MVRRPKDQGGAKRGVQGGPEVGRKAGIPIRDQDVREANVAEYGAHKLGGGHRRSRRLVRGNEPDAASEKINVDLEEIVAGGGCRHLHEVRTKS